MSLRTTTIDFLTIRFMLTQFYRSFQGLEGYQGNVKVIFVMGGSKLLD